jgi:hypothetical protein
MILVLSIASSVSVSGGDVAPRIVDGTQVPESTFPTVGRVKIVESLGDFDEVSMSTGTLIAPSFVITAAHSVRSAQFGRLFTDPKNITFTLGGVDYAVTRYFVHPTEQNGIIINQEGFLDISILQLATAVPGVTPSPIMRQPPTVGSQMIIAGYGLTGSGLKGFDPKHQTFPPQGSIQFGQAPLETLTPTLIEWTFKQVAPPNNESDTAPGDSGGPAFIVVGGQNVLVGVTSGGNSPTSAFGDQPFDTRVDIATDWIDSIISGKSEFTSPPTATPPAAKAKTLITFTAAAGTDQIAWDFGDGSNSPAGAGTAKHAYIASGTYLVAATAISSNGNTATQTLSITIGDFLGHAAGDIVSGLKLPKKQFTIPSAAGLNARRTPGSSTTITFFHPDFVSTFLDFNKSVVRILIANQELFSIVNNTEIFRNTKFKVNTTKGTITFSSKQESVGPVFADAVGTQSGPVKIPVTLSVNGVLYSDIFTFNVVAKGSKVTGK